MAVGTTLSPGIVRGGSDPSGSVKVSRWIEAHDSLLATAASAGVLKRPLSNTSSNTHFIKVPDGATRMMICARHSGTSLVDTSPVVDIFSVYGEPGSTGFADSVSSNGSASGHDVIAIKQSATLTCATTDIEVGTNPAVVYQYGVLATNAAGDPWFDVLGGGHVLILCRTAAVLTDANECKAVVAFLN